MKSRFSLLALAGAVAVCLLPSGQVQSQVPGMDVFTALQDLVQKNDQLIKRQEETLKTVEDLMTEAKQARIMSKRG
ncbi:MAG: hypothetical protein JSR82_10505 [Verrucomicrobia bacterium]|nr:hypothetical protein [Verrucomicrobiota bacterium]